MTSVLHICAALSAIIAIYLANLRSEPRLAHGLLAVVFTLFSIQHALTSFALLELGPSLVWWRPVSAMALPPAIFLHLRAASGSGKAIGFLDLLHIGGPAGLTLARFALPDGPHLDAAIVASLVFYGCFALLRIGTSTPAARRWKYMVCSWLFLMAVADLLVMVELTGSDDLGHSRTLIVLIAGFFAFLVYFLLTSLNRTGPLSWIITRVRRVGAEPTSLKAQLETFMAEARPWLDPELTVARLARKLGLPQRTVSEFVNDQYETSVSRWINGWRVAEAQRLIRAAPERPLVELMLDCGFQTRSNFNKAFKDITAETPSEWRKRECSVSR